MYTIMWTSGFNSKCTWPRFRAVTKVPDICFRREKERCDWKKVVIDRHFGLQLTCPFSFILKLT